MKVRCYNKNTDHWERYGARGITVCDEWRNNYEAFRDWALENGYTDELTLDRKDWNGNYEPSNCRWVTNAEQQRNKSNNKRYAFNGKTQLLSQWARDFGVTDSMVRSRIQKGADPIAVLSMYAGRVGN